MVEVVNSHAETSPPAASVQNSGEGGLHRLLGEVGRRSQGQAWTIAICVVLVIACVAFLLLAVIDRAFPLADGLWRWLPWAVVWIGAAVAAWRLALRPLVAWGGNLGKARFAEQRQPQLRDELSSAIDLEASDNSDQSPAVRGFEGSRALRQYSLDRANRIASDVDARGLFPWRPHLRWLVLAPTALLLLIGALILAPAIRGPLYRVAIPWSNAAIPGDQRFVLLSPEVDLPLAAREPIEVVVDAPGWGRPAQLELAANRSQASRTIELVPDPTDPDKLVGAIDVDVAGAQRIRVSAGRQRTKWWSLQFCDRPEALAYERAIELPAYVRAEGTDGILRLADTTTGVISSLEKSGITVDLVANTDLNEASIEWLKFPEVSQLGGANITDSKAENDNLEQVDQHAAPVLDTDAEPQVAGKLAPTKIDGTRARFEFPLELGQRHYRVRMTGRDGYLVGVSDHFLVEGLVDQLPTIQVQKPMAEVSQVDPGARLGLEFSVSDDFGLVEIRRSVFVNGDEIQAMSEARPVAGIEANFRQNIDTDSLGLNAGDVLTVRLEASDLSDRYGLPSERVFLVGGALGLQQEREWIQRQATAAQQLQKVANAAQRLQRRIREDKLGQNQKNDSQEDSDWFRANERMERLKEEITEARQALATARPAARDTLERRDIDAMARALAVLEARLAKPIESAINQQDAGRGELQKKADELAGHSHSLADRAGVLATEDLLTSARRQSTETRKATERASKSETAQSTSRQVASAKTEGLEETLAAIARDFDGGNRQRMTEHIDKIDEIGQAMREEASEYPDRLMDEELKKLDPWLEQKEKEYVGRAAQMREQLMIFQNEMYAMWEAQDGAGKLDSARDRNKKLRNEGEQKIDSASDLLAAMARAANATPDLPVELAKPKSTPDGRASQAATDRAQIAQALDQIPAAESPEGNREKAQQLDRQMRKILASETAADLEKMLRELAATPDKLDVAGMNNPTAKSAAEQQSQQNRGVASQARKMLEEMAQHGHSANLTQEQRKALDDLKNSPESQSLNNERNDPGSADREGLKQLADRVANASDMLDAIAEQARQELASSLPKPSEQLSQLAAESELQAKRSRQLTEKMAGEAGAGQASQQAQQEMRDLASDAADTQNDIEQFRDAMIADANNRKLGDAQEREAARSSDSTAAKLSQELDRGSSEETLGKAANAPARAAQMAAVTDAAQEQQRRADELNHAAWQMAQAEVAQEKNSEMAAHQPNGAGQNSDAADIQAPSSEMPQGLREEWKRAELLAAIGEELKAQSQAGSSPLGDSKNASSEPPSAASQQALDDAIARQMAGDPVLRAAVEDIAEKLADAATQSLNDVAAGEKVLAEQVTEASSGSGQISPEQAQQFADQQAALQDQTTRAQEQLERASEHQARLANQGMAEALKATQEGIGEVSEGAMQAAQQALGQTSAEASSTAASGSPTPSSPASPSPTKAGQALDAAGDQLAEQLADLVAAMSASQGAGAASPGGQEPMMQPLAEAIDQLAQARNASEAAQSAATQGQSNPSQASQSPSSQSPSSESGQMQASGQSQGQPGSPGQPSGTVPKPSQPTVEQMIAAQSAALAQARASSMLGMPVPGQIQTPGGQPQQAAQSQGQPRESSGQPSQPGEGQGLGQSQQSSNSPTSESMQATGGLHEGGLPEGMVALDIGDTVDADWDALPTRVAEGVRQGRRQAVAPEFRDAISNYYKGIAERAKKR